MDEVLPVKKSVCRAFMGWVWQQAGKRGLTAVL